MKKMLLASLLSATALGLHAQGQLFFTDYGVSLISHIYSPNLTAPSTGQISGNTAADRPAGSTTYPDAVLLGGYASTGGANPNGLYGVGSDWTVQVEALGGATTAVPLSSLQPVTPNYTATMVASLNNPAAGQGQWAPPSQVDPGIPNTPGASPVADIAVACWYSGPTSGGLVGVSSLAAAETTPGAVWGESPEVVDFALLEPESEQGVFSGPFSTVPDLSTTTFQVTQNPESTPEPNAIALGLMAVSYYAVRRRGGQN